MTLCHSTIYKIIAILPLHQQGLASYVVYITTTYSYDHMYRALQRQRQHTYTHTRHTQFKQGEDHSNRDRLPDISGRPHPSTRARSAFTCLTQSPHPLTRGGLAVGSTSVSILRWGIAYRDDLPIHDGFLKRAPRISATQTNGKIRQKGRHNGGWKYLWKLEEEERETESQKAQEQARK